MSLTPEQRSLRARMAAHSMHAQHDSRVTTAPGRAAGPGQLSYWLKKVDPDGTLPESERQRRAEQAKKQHYTALAYKSSVARSRKRAA